MDSNKPWKALKETGIPDHLTCLLRNLYVGQEVTVRILYGTTERADRMWSTGKGNGKPLQYSCLENPMNSMKRQNDRLLKEVLPRSVGTQYATGGQWRNNSRKNEGTEPKQKQHPAMDVTGDRSKI